MPTEGAIRPCTRPGCNGVMRFSTTAKPAGSQVGTGLDDGRIAWENRPQPGWLCNKNPEHFDPK
jgi:hypothetical protein